MSAAGDLLYLADVVQVVSAHGFDDGPEGHGSPFRMANGGIERRRRKRCDELDIELANGAEGG